VRSPIRTLSGRLAVVHVLVLLAVAFTIGWLALRAQRQYALEADQRLNAHLAQNLASEFAPFIRDMPDYARVEETIHNLMVYNPRIEIYVLDSTGTILSYFSDPEKIVRGRVDTGPIRRFIDGRFTYPLLGQDPRSADGSKPFSAAPIDLGNRTGILYVILGGELVEASLNASSGSYIARLFAISLGIVVLVSVLIGLGLFVAQTRRFRSMTAAVRRFASGDTGVRIPLSGNDDVAELSRSFNEMADRIESALEDLRRTDQQRREQVANISHDLKTPLSSILGFVETVRLRGESLPPDERDRYLKVVQANAETLGRLVAELSELARLESLTIELAREEFNLEELVQDVAMSFAPMAQEKQVTIRTELAGTPPRVTADVGMIERVLANLIRNALQHTDPGGMITAVVEHADDHVTVQVRDTGCGIAPDDLPRVTERFYRVDKSRRTGSGMGLGLSIVEMILRLHGSRLDITSELGRGTTVSFALGQP